MLRDVQKLKMNQTKKHHNDCCQILTKLLAGSLNNFEEKKPYSCPSFIRLHPLQYSVVHLLLGFLGGYSLSWPPPDSAIGKGTISLCEQDEFPVSFWH